MKEIRDNYVTLSMTNKIILMVVAFALVIGVFAVMQKSTVEPIENNDTEVKQAVESESLSNTAGEEEYVIDESDMYYVDMANLEADSTLSEKEIEWLLLMREEEKLARDVYLTLGDQWGMQIFTNIAGSEQTHTDAIKTLLDTYGLADPVVDDAVGVFANAEMQKLYNDLTELGSTSLLDALVVGATIEDLDIKDLEIAMGETDNADIDVVYQNLQKGSRNHMRAFTRQIARQGGTYTPQYISVEEYESIINGSQERGRIW